MHISRQIVARLALVLAVVVAALAMTASSAFANELPGQWDPRTVAVNHDAQNSFLLRPGQILAGPGDAADVQRVLTGWRQGEQRPFGITSFTRAPQSDDPAREMLAALAKVRRATANRPQGPAQVAPNHVFVGEAAASAINFYGEPRLQGGPGSTVRPAPRPAALPLRTTTPGDGQGVRIAVLDTGMFDHEWLKSVQRAPGSDDVWDVERDGYADAEAGHGTFIAGLIAAGRARRVGVRGQGARLARRRRRPQRRGRDRAAARRTSTSSTSRSAATPTATRRRWRSRPRVQAFGEKGGAVVAAAGNHGKSRPFWPAAFEPVLAVGAVEERRRQVVARRATATTARGSTRPPAARTCSPRSRA